MVESFRANVDNRVSSFPLHFTYYLVGEFDNVTELTWKNNTTKIGCKRSRDMELTADMGFET